MFADQSRREFLQTTGVGVAAGLAAATASRAAEGERITLGFIGCGGMGSNHLGMLAARGDVRLKFVCDVDQKRLESAVKKVADGSGTAPEPVGDMRRILDDPQIDAVFIATPDHWHAPAAILALNAGKHVYVEKPCCHNVREGGLMVAAVKRSGKLLQVGTQSRSTAVIAEAMERLHKGEIGEVLVAKAWNSQRRGSIGRSQPQPPPPELDFDSWLGPAPVTDYRPNLLHANWRWWRDFGCGDAGNDGVHDIDVALWGLNVTTHPSTVTCLGGKSFFDDDQQHCDTQYAVCEYPVDGLPSGKKRQLIFEQRIWSPYVQEGYENGCAFYGTEGILIIGHTVGWKLFGPRMKLLAERTGPADLKGHHDNFFNCIRGTEKKLNADIHAGHRAATIVHLANIAARTGTVLQFDPEKEEIRNSAEANALLARMYRQGHWAVPT